MGLDELLGVAATQPGTVGLFFDFDGTLSRIQDDPASVQPLPDVVSSLEALTERLGVIAIVSGRPVSFLEQHFQNPNVQLSGLYGIERRIDGRPDTDPQALKWSTTMAAIIDMARGEFGEAAVEDKQHSLTVHYRRESEDFATAVHEWAEGVALATGVDMHGAKQSVELHPPIERSKGDAVQDLAKGITAAGYFGDDLGDIPAFERIAAMTTNGSLSVSARVLVAGPETSESLRDHATDVFDSPDCVRDTIVNLTETLTSR